MNGMEININCDLGEKSELHSIVNDPELLKIVNSASIACGYHAGDEQTMDFTIKTSKKNGVSIGAHPSFKDTKNFGRKRINLSEKEITELIVDQYNILQSIAERYNENVSPDNIMIVPGGKVIIFFSAMLMGEKNKEILYPNPGFPIYESAINYSGAKSIPYQLREDKGFSFSAEDILNKINTNTSLIIINSPANPTGGLVPKSELKKLVKGLEKYPDVLLMSDEIYDQFCFGENEFTSMLQFPEIRDRLIILNGWSKTYAMTGWRLGYGIFPLKLYEIAEKLAVNIHSCVNSSAQYAALEALNGPQNCVSEMNTHFKRRANLMYSGLNEIKGFSCQKPNGAFYCFPNITGTGKNSTEIQNILLDNLGVATVAGTSFGEYGEGYIRLSCANSDSAIEEAIIRIKGFFN